MTNRTVDYYTHLQLLDYQRSDNNYRVYGQGMIERIHHIEKLKQQGHSLKEIQQLIKTKEVIDVQDIRLQVLQLEKDMTSIAKANNLTQAKQMAIKDLALIKALLLLIQ